MRVVTTPSDRNSNWECDFTSVQYIEEFLPGSKVSPGAAIVHIVICVQHHF